MCMITFIPNGVDVPSEGIHEGSKRNKDGHGWAVASRKGLVYGKSMIFAEAIDGLLAARKEHPGSAALFHSRYATHGKYGEYNVHPFFTGANSVMAHNGVLPSEFLPVHGDDRSDTRVFVDSVGWFYSQNPNGVPSRRASKAISKLIGGGNKLVFLAATDSGPKSRIVNSDAGTWAGGAWFSNTQFMAPKWTTNHTATLGAGLGYPYGNTPYKPATSTPARRVWTETEDDGVWVPYNARGYYGDDLYSERNMTESQLDRDAQKVIEKYYQHTPPCPRCGSLGIDEIAQVCVDCNLCLDCDNDLEDCTCVTDLARWIEANK